MYLFLVHSKQISSTYIYTTRITNIYSATPNEKVQHFTRGKQVMISLSQSWATNRRAFPSFSGTERNKCAHDFHNKWFSSFPFAHVYVPGIHLAHAHLNACGDRRVKFVIFVECFSECIPFLCWVHLHYAVIAFETLGAKERRQESIFICRQILLRHDRWSVLVIFNVSTKLPGRCQSPGKTNIFRLSNARRIMMTQERTNTECNG